MVNRQARIVAYADDYVLLIMTTLPAFSSRAIPTFPGDSRLPGLPRPQRWNLAVTPASPRRFRVTFRIAMPAAVIAVAAAMVVVITPP